MVAISLPLVVTLICSPALAFSKYFNRLALKSLIFTVCIGAPIAACTECLYNIAQKA